MNPKPNAADLVHLVEVAGQFAEIVIVKQRDSLNPSWVLWNPDGPEIIQTPWSNPEEKAQSAWFLRHHMKRSGTQAYSFVVEAWRAYARDKAGNPVSDLSQWNQTSAAQAPDKEECVMAFATNGTATEQRAWKIVRDWNEIVTGLVRSDFGATTFEGWMTDLLKR